MLLQTLWFEIRNRLSKTSSIVFFSIFFLFAFFMAIIFGDAFQGINVNFGLSNQIALNSPALINQLVTSVGALGLLVAAPIFGQAICKDYESDFCQILFTTPMTKRVYFLTRFLGSLFTLLVILSSAGWGIWVATQMPFVDQSLLVQNRFYFYLSPYLTTVLPNLFFLGSILIAIASYFKKTSAVYLGTIVLFVVQMIAGKFLADIDNRFFAALLDPFGAISLQELVRYWSVAEQNTRAIPLAGVFLFNRLLWVGIGSLLLFIGYLLFKPYQLVREKKKDPVASRPSSLQKPRVDQKEGSLKSFFLIAMSEFRQVFFSIQFLVCFLLGVVFLVLYSSQVGKIFGTQTLPVTYQIIDMAYGSFQLLLMILTLYFAGELVWKDREKGMFEIVDSKPVSSLYFYLTKLGSLFLLQIFFGCLMLLSGITIQMAKGYFSFELGVYFKSLFLYLLVPNLLVCVFSLFAQTVSKNKAIGHFIVIFLFVAISALPRLGFDHKLYLMGELPTPVYSDMNQFGPTPYPFLLFTLYWGFFYLMLATFTVLGWPRGVIGKWKSRIKGMKYRVRNHHKWMMTTTCGCWILMGGFLFYNINVLNEYKTQKTGVKEAVAYELTYKKHEEKLFPELIAVNVNVDLFPKKHGLHAKGSFLYQNTSKEPIKTLFLNVDKDVVLEWGQEATLKTQDLRLSVFIYELEHPLQPGGEIELSFHLEKFPRGISNGEFNSKIFDNGTFFYGADCFPVMGYLPGRELASDKVRKKHGLGEKPLMNEIDDEGALQRTCISREGSWIDFEATLSTDQDQIAIAPGYLENTWEEGNRRYFHYKMDQPMLNFYAFLSGRYAIAEDQWNDVKIEIYHHPTHTTNVPRMIQAIKQSLDYYTQNFSPYQFKQLRIIEFPRYSSFAQSFPNTIPFSEGLGFIAKIDDKDPECIDYVFYVTAHEVAHQWWAHQVIGGDVQGAPMLMESLAQYSALMVQEREYGPEQMRKFLKYELDNYLMGRTVESKGEEPLMLNRGQPYIHYNKGSLVFYTLKDSLGEETVNNVLRDYIQDVAFQRAPYTRSIDLVQRFKEAAPDDKKSLIEDLFETITFYSNQTEKAHVTKNEDGYEVVIISKNQKFRSDGWGKEEEVPMEEEMDVGIFDEKGTTLYLKKHKVTSGENVFHILVDEKPHQAGVDPINKLIDKDPNHHRVKVIEA